MTNIEQLTAVTGYFLPNRVSVVSKKITLKFLFVNIWILKKFNKK